MPAKLLWLQNQLPETWKRANKVCLISDYLTILLTGKHVSEAGAAGLTGLVDIHRCEWWPEMLARFELDHCSLPTLVRAGTDLGPIHSPAAERFGLPRDCRFVVGCLDQYAGAIGMGCVNPNMISETTGTVLATVQCTDQFATPVSLDVFQGPAFRKGLYWRMAFGEVSANYLEWYRDQLRDRPDFDQLTELAEQIEPGAHGLRLRTNERPTELEKVFDGLTSRHTRGDMVRCIMEAVARALADQVSTLSKGAPPLEIRCAGGAARNDFWLQIKADVAGITTVASECEEPTSLGAAMLAEASLSSTDLLQLTQQWVRLKSLHRCNTQYHHNKRSLHSHAVGAT
jgi:xylulokinase